MVKKALFFVIKFNYFILLINIVITLTINLKLVINIMCLGECKRERKKRERFCLCAWLQSKGSTLSETRAKWSTCSGKLRDRFLAVWPRLFLPISPGSAACMGRGCYLAVFSLKSASDLRLFGFLRHIKKCEVLF